MKTLHTPGPWTFAYGSVYKTEPLTDENSTRIALMDRDESRTMPTERDANARLIAAAPELLAALRQSQAALQTAFEHLTSDGMFDHPASSIVADAECAARTLLNHLEETP